MAIPEGFETLIESKIFQFKITNRNAIHISEMKFVVLSTIDLDLKRVSWLKESITKLYSDTWSSPKLELKDLLLLYDSNVYGGFIRIIEKGHDSLFIPEGWNGLGIKRFLIGITRSINLMKELAVRMTTSNSSGFVDTKPAMDLFTPWLDRDLSYENVSSISGSLFQVDIERSVCFDKSLVLDSSEDLCTSQLI
ncbi:unnamed protein product [Cuscuta epithymum]|uniref:Uncharacterized protein n=1 Tax=Cuscuta epithymum TaxID=186058 RepID=A0AAV0G3W5_9ASTE|nr:unnamed protein product [Cuscuta epithymum]CAH9142268.1 unnamed protein product [Cuscuta epithymum]